MGMAWPSLRGAELGVPRIPRLLRVATFPFQPFCHLYFHLYLWKWVRCPSVSLEFHDRCIATEAAVIVFTFLRFLSFESIFSSRSSQFWWLLPFWNTPVQFVLEVSFQFLWLNDKNKKMTTTTMMMMLLLNRLILNHLAGSTGWWGLTEQKALLCPKFHFFLCWF